MLPRDLLRDSGLEELRLQFGQQRSPDDSRLRHPKINGSLHKLRKSQPSTSIFLQA